MKLEFDSITELENFLMFSAHIGKAFAVAPEPVQRVDAAADFYAAPDNVNGNTIKLTDEQVALLDAEYQAAIGAPVKATQGEDGPLMADGGAAEAPKRRRRTKAEIEADKAAEGKTVAPAAEGAPADTSAMTGAAVAEPASTPGAGNPFAVAPAMQAVLDAPNQGAATLAAMAATQNAETAPAAPRVIESIEHLRACQGFIQKHGMAKYNETFRDGLNANIAIYTPEQRAQHVTILESLDS
jgi:hypothetical protein